ncbi:hypothetical protein ES689_14700 [Frigoribacterium sp. ACAM 257]|uniref:hypothetical protein n=1 Tax=Frigoribacterium sp. ACAM 257 TaxID=2508998 RepID=UPI0011BA047A|nr:hypothetical protein [Frigoribacterium sp. ACAM 257]TWX34560.1 hypothetical protein ES689_14700 [Frigoribacterium sp. ACAM 257]
MTRRRSTTLGVTALVAATLIGLTGCAGGAAGDDVTAEPTETVTVPAPTTTPGTTPSPTAEPTGPTDTAEPTETAVAAPLVTIPADCTQIVDQATAAATFGSTPLNPAEFPRRDGTARGARTASVPAAGAQPFQIVDAAAELDCLWRDPAADITGIGVVLGRLDQPTAASLLDQVSAAGATCQEAHGGQLCQQPLTNTEPYDVEAAATWFVRGDLYIAVEQFNVPTNDLIGSILAHLES